MSTLTREQASEVIANIRADNGGISKEDRDVTPPRVLNALANVRRKLAGATKILINNLYSKDTRFIYELVQNAEDNSYANAIKAGERPFLAFRVYSDRIVVDSNEDGFDEDNVKAICSTGESTKAISDGYIGEKGIGFKSVFKIAKKVYIQSGPFSFSFDHAQRDDDDGLGMVTPMSEQFEELPAKIRTRMTLMLLDDIELERVLVDFWNVPDTLLLFLRKLQDLTIEIHRPGNTTTSFTYSKQEQARNGIYEVSLSKITQDNAASPSSQQKFYVVKRETQGLPHDVARVDKNGKSINHATTILAFPVDADDSPMLKPQHVFAFLPLRQVGFNFLIQSDFVTQANREDVVHTPRNEALLDGVAMAFRDAVLHFCNHKSLRYQWMRYLPSMSISDQWWKELEKKISDRLRTSPVLRSWSEKNLYAPSQLRRLPPYYFDGSGEPLLPDLPQEIYLSPKYLSDDCQTLHRLGLCLITWGEAIDRLRADLAKPTSRWKSVTSDSDWRTRTSDLLLRAFKSDTTVCVNACTDMKKMALIPTEDRRWVSSEQLTVYFPGTKDVSIPTDLGLNLLSMAATSNASWRRLLCELGVVECPPDSVMASIAHRYAKGAVPAMTLENSITHSRYLYWNLPIGKSIVDLGIWLFNHHMQPVPKVEHLYFEKLQDSDSLVDLFKEGASDDEFSPPGYDAHFLHPEYIKAVNEKACRNGMSWLSWLEVAGEVQAIPQLCAKGVTHLSKEFEYILEYRSERLPWILRASWPIYEKEIGHVENKLRKWPVDTKRSDQPLDKTFLPLPKLQSLVEEYHVPGFDFISMSPQPRDEEIKDWRFLERLGIRMDDDIHFYVRAITEIGRANDDEFKPVEDAIFKLYHQIQKRCNEDLDMVCHEFSDHCLLYIPAHEMMEATWVSPEDCVWNGPDWLRSKRRLNVAQYTGLEALVKTILKIPDATPSNVLKDLIDLSDKDTNEANEAEVIYSYLSREVQSSQTAESRKQLREEVRDTFEEFALVYVPHMKDWYRPSACVWAGPHVEIPEKASIAAAYDAKKTFFIKVLLVPEPSAAMYIQSLISQAKSQPMASKIKETIKLIACLGVTATDVSELLRINIFPITLPNGQSSFLSAAPVSGSPEFAILDSVVHWNAFRGKVAYLDFSMEEIRDTRPFLNACGLQGRFTSNLVENVTDVEGGVLDDEMAQTLRLKALALVRCATHYTRLSQAGYGEDPNVIYGQLQRARVYVSDGISQSMRMQLNGQTTEGKRDKANFHLETSGDELSFYLPKDEWERNMCFERHLPRRFREYLKITDPSAESVLSILFRYQDAIFVEKILEDAGIAHVTVNDDPNPTDEKIGEQRERLPKNQQAGPMSDEEEEGAASSEEYEEDGLSDQRTASYSNLARTQRPVTPPRRIRNSSAATTSSQPSGLLMPTSGQFRAVVSKNQDASYERVLNNVVTVARRRAAEDSLGGESRDSLVPLLVNLSPEVIKQGFGERSIDRDRRVGAAGELYVFEYLKNLRLAGFDMSNWRSVIRDYAAAHHDYRDIARWSGASRDSLVDIEYKDIEGQLTNFLIRKGHLAEEVWSRKHPHYYFEVKATTSSSRQERFFVSRAQYDHLQNMQTEEGKASPKIYIIIRIYSLGQGNATGFDVYVDPESQRQLGRLEFRAETWAVTPNLTASERFEQPEGAPPIRREPADENLLAAKDIDGIPTNGSIQPTTTPTPSAIALPNRGSKFFVNGKMVLVRLPQLDGLSRPPDSKSLSPRDQFDRPPVGPGANTSELPILGPIIQRVTDQISNLRTSSPPLLDTSSHSSGSNINGGIFDSLPKPGLKSLLSATPAASECSTGGQTTPASGANLFGTMTTTSTPALGSTNLLTPSKPVDSSGGNFASKSVGVFGTPAAGSSHAGITPQGAPTGQATPLSGNNVFGQKSLPSGTSLFNQSAPPAGTSVFGTPPTAGTSLLGQKPPPAAPSFGQASSSNGTSSFGQPSLFGQASSSDGTSSFGQPSLFGQASSSNETSSFGQPSRFGQASSSNGTISFGQSSLLTNASPFGQNAPTTGKSLFGQSAPPVGTSLFGQAPSPTGANLFGPGPSSAGTGAAQQGPPFAGKGHFGQTATTSSFSASPHGNINPFMRFDLPERAKTWTSTAPSTFGAGKPPYYHENDVVPTLQDYMSLTFKLPFQKHSFEELRLRDYSSGLRWVHRP